MYKSESLHFKEISRSRKTIFLVLFLASSVLILFSLVFLGNFVRADSGSVQGVFSSNSAVVYSPTSDTRIIYVSSSQGSDSNSGLSPEDPVKTPEEGLKLIRDGHADWLLFKRGDVFTQGFSIYKSGPSKENPIVIGSYGDPSEPMPYFKIDGYFMNVIGGSPSNISIVGLHISDDKRNPESGDYDPNSKAGDGIRWVTNSENILIENCLVEWFQMGIVFQSTGNGEISNLSLINNIVRNNYPSNYEDSSGAFLQGVRGLVLEGNVFDQNGWLGEGRRSVRNHDVYTYNVHGALIKNNIFSDASYGGLKVKGEGSAGATTNLEITGNLFLRDGSGVIPGENGEIDYSVEGINVTNNLFEGIGGAVTLENGDITKQSLGIDTKSISDGIFNKNIFVDNNFKEGFSSWAIDISDWRDQRDISIEGNVVSPSWGYTKGPYLFNSGATDFSGNLVINKSNSADYPDPYRNVEDYYKSIGGSGDLSSFIEDAEEFGLSGKYSPSEVINYVRAGFSNQGSDDGARVKLDENAGSSAGFSNLNQIYKIESGDNLSLNVSSKIEASNVVFQVWSNVSGKVEGAYTDYQRPFVYPAVYLDNVTPGVGYVQALIRDKNDIIVKEVSLPANFIYLNSGQKNNFTDGNVTKNIVENFGTGDFRANVGLVPTIYYEGSGVSLVLSQNISNIDNVVFQVWSNVSGKIEGAYTDYQKPFVYPSSYLDEVTPGVGYVQALIRDKDDRILDRSEFEIYFSGSGNLENSVSPGDSSGGSGRGRISESFGGSIVDFFCNIFGC